MLRMMLEDGGQDARPDNYTFSAMLRAVASSKMWALLPKVYRMMQRLQVSTGGRAVAGCWRSTLGGRWQGDGSGARAHRRIARKMWGWLGWTCCSLDYFQTPAPVYWYCSGLNCIQAKPVPTVSCDL